MKNFFASPDLERIGDNPDQLWRLSFGTRRIKGEWQPKDCASYDCRTPTIMAMEGPATSGQPQFSQLLYQPCPQVPPKEVVAQPDREQGGPWAALLMRASTLT